MNYALRVHNAAKRDLDRLNDKTYRRISEKIASLQVNPRPYGCEKLQGRESYRTRVGDFRVIYEIYDKEKIVEILSVLNRKEAYKKKK